MSKVTIIIPVYNSAEYIGKCIESILNQTYHDYDILIVNDGSKDNSQQIINEYKEKYPNKITAIEQENKGVARTRNESIKRATGKYIMFMDNDDYLDKDYIETFVKEIEKAILTSDLGLNPTNDGKVIRLVFPEVTEERRKALVKDVKKKGEDAKVAVRNVRRDGNDFLKKLGKEDVSEDEIKELEDQLQKLTDKFGKDIDKLVEAKSKEIMTV